MGTEDWVLKGTKLITNTKKQRLKCRVESGISKIQYYRKEEEEKKNKVTKIIKKIYMKFALKNRVSLFLQSNSRL